MADLILEVIEGADAGRQVDVADSVELGRDPSLTVVIDDDQVSRHHARISVQAGQAVVEDLGSMNRTYINEQPIAAARQLSPMTRSGSARRCCSSGLRSRSPSRRPQPTVPDLTVVADVLRPRRRRSSRPRPRCPAHGRAATGFVPAEVVEDAEARSDYEAIARLLDSSVNRQTNLAVIALLGPPAWRRSSPSGSSSASSRDRGFAPPYLKGSVT